MKKVFILLLNFALGLSAKSVDLVEADKLFEKDLYDQALAKYESVEKKSSGDEKLMAMYRAVECEGLLFRYTEALKRIYSYKIPENDIWKARFLLLRAETAREFLNQYGYSLPQDIEENATEPEKLTRKEWLKRISKSYDEIWNLREKLINIPIKNEDYFIDIKKADLSYTPSFWDFIVLKWSEFLISNDEDNKNLPSAEDFINDKYEKKFSPSLISAEKIAVIYEESYNLKGNNRDEAREIWKLKRVLLPFSVSHLIEPFKNSNSIDNVILMLKNFINDFKTTLGKSEAGYELASLFNKRGDYKEAVEICQKIEKDFGYTKAAKKCEKLRNSIEMPSLTLSAITSAPPGKKSVSVNAKNIDTLFYRIYSTTIEDLKEKSSNENQKYNNWQFLKYINNNTLEKFLNYSKPIYSGSIKINYEKPYTYKNTELNLPDLKSGIYIIAVSNEDNFTAGNSIIQGTILNITELALIGSSGINGNPADFIFDPLNPSKNIMTNIFHLYTINPITGLPQPNTELKIYKRQNYQNIEEIQSLSDSNGILNLKLPVYINKDANNNYTIDPLAHKGDNYAWWRNEDYFYYNPPLPIEIFIETDRPIYRPGQKVEFKVTVLEKTKEGYKVYNGSDKIMAIARDSNYEEFFKKEISLNQMGSAAASFIIPTGK